MSRQLVALGLGLALIAWATIAWALLVWRDLELAFQQQQQRQRSRYPTRDPAGQDTEVL